MKKSKARITGVQKLVANAEKHPFYWIVAIGYIFIYSVIVLAFYPGFMSYDSINQYSQLLGLIPLNDWHPPAMALLWKLLISMTGLTGSLLIFTVGMFILSSFLLSLYFYKITKNKLASLMPLALLLLPNILTFLGVLWKDVLLAAFFMLGTVLILLGSSTHELWKLKKSYRNTLLLVGALVLLFGSTFRHGVWPAFIPLLVFSAWKLEFNKKIKLLAAVSYVLLATLIPASIIRVFSVKDGQASIVIMVDDIINTATESEIRDSELSDDSKEYLINVKSQCRAIGVRAYAAFLCDETHIDFSRTVSKEFENTQDFWIDSIKQDPSEYLIHRTKVFIDFLNPSSIFAWQDRTDPNQFNIEALDTPLTYIVEDYVDFFIQDWPSFFKPYFWLLLSTVLSIATFKRRRQLTHSALSLVIFITSLLLLASFLPAAIVSDYRMTYTFTFASLLILMLYVVDMLSRRSAQNNKKLKKSK